MQISNTSPGTVLAVVVVGLLQTGRVGVEERWAGVHVPQTGHAMEEQPQVEEELQHPGRQKKKKNFIIIIIQNVYKAHKSAKNDHGTYRANMVIKTKATYMYIVANKMQSYDLPMEKQNKHLHMILTIRALHEMCF